MKLFLLIALLPFAALAEVKPLRIYLTHATGAHGLIGPELDLAMQDVRSLLLLEFHLPTRIVVKRQIKNTCNLSTFAFPAQLNCTRKWGEERGKRLINLAITPPLVDHQGLRYIGGASYHGEINPGYAWFAAALWNNNYEPRWWHSINGIIHEISHSCRANHINSQPNLMHRYASQYVTAGFLPVLPKTRREVKRGCGRAKNIPVQVR